MMVLFLTIETDSPSIALYWTYAILIPKVFQLIVSLLFQSNLLMASAEDVHEDQGNR